MARKDKAVIAAAAWNRYWRDKGKLPRKQREIALRVVLLQLKAGQ